VYDGEVQKALIYDDYAHHPVEVAASISSLKTSFPNRRLRVVFQPHTFSRTELFLNEFAESLYPADEIILLPIYSSAREAKGGVSIESLQKCLEDLNHSNVYKATDLGDAQKWIISNIDAGDLIVTLGAGDVWQIAKSIVQESK